MFFFFFLLSFSSYECPVFAHIQNKNKNGRGRGIPVVECDDNDILSREESSIVLIGVSELPLASVLVYVHRQVGVGGSVLWRNNVDEKTKIKFN